MDQEHVIEAEPEREATATERDLSIHHRPFDLTGECSEQGDRRCGHPKQVADA